MVVWPSLSFVRTIAQELNPFIEQFYVVVVFLFFLANLCCGHIVRSYCGSNIVHGHSLHLRVHKSRLEIILIYYVHVIGLVRWKD